MVYSPDYQYIPPLNFRVVTGFYDFFCGIFGLGKGFKQSILQVAEIQDGPSILDIGCGTGIFLEVAKTKFPKSRVVGIDPDQKALEIARNRLEKKHLEAELEKGFAEALPFADETFDFCFSTLTLHHLPNEIKRTALGEMRRVLRIGGTGIITDIGPSKSWFWRKVLVFEKLEYLEGNLQGLVPRYLEEAGFREQKVALKKFPAILTIVVRK